MEWANIILNFIIATGIISTFVHYKSKNREASANANKTEAEADMAAFDSLEEKIAFLDKQLVESFEQRERLQNLLNDSRDCEIKMGQELADVKVELMRVKEKLMAAEWNVCVVPNCPKREPKRQ